MKTTQTIHAAADLTGLAARIDRFLPQTQCAECGEPSCRAYAEAVAAGAADIDRCPPGGAATVDALSRLLGRAAVDSPSSPTSPNSPATTESPETPAPRPPLQLAFIREEACIGCKLCIAACPVDCIIGAGKLMHTVIAAACSGCRLCLAVCPTDCIDMVAPPPDYAAGAPSMWREFSHAQVGEFRRRAEMKREREAAQQTRREQQAMQRRRDAMRAEIRDAVARVRRRQAQAGRRFVSAPMPHDSPASPALKPSPAQPSTTPPSSPSQPSTTPSLSPSSPSPPSSPPSPTPSQSQ
ncbi:MAG: RnfABCDGE type electron transport complex subunit B [Gammaproteobacteria bacterium]|nr:RnfABCDGE type electron transport complex subunit B [Gammaproteobacteria bacterium]